MEHAQSLEHVLRDFEGWLQQHGCFAGGSPLQPHQTFAPVTWTNWDLQVQLVSFPRRPLSCRCADASMTRLLPQHARKGGGVTR